MSQQRALELISQAKQNNARRLNLSDLELTELPPEIAELTELRVLWLANNCLQSLPPQIGKLTRLLSLRAENNRLKSLPPEIGELSELRRIALHKNRLAEFPEEFWDLCNLQRLITAGNRVEKVPYGIGRLANLRVLKFGGYFRKWQEWLGNQLSELPPVIAELKNLQSLNLSFNQLSELPPVIAELKNLQSLDLRNNQLSELPEEIIGFDDDLEFLIDGNPLGFPPLEIAQQGVKSIREYLNQETERKWISKMVVVGQGRVGKTSLLKRLRDNVFDPELSSTHGMLIGDLELPHPTEPGVLMTLNTWDFGGQEHYHAPHQYFLTDQALYLIAWNAGQNYESGGVLYWLDTVTARAPKAKILLVATHIDQRKPDLPFEDLKKRYPNQIVGELFGISNTTGEGREELCQAIAEAAAEIKMMGLKWPVAWWGAAESLRKKSKKTKYLAPEKLNASFSRQKVKRDSHLALARRLHVLGEILYYDEKEHLKDTVMLDPQWVTQIISRVLDNKIVADNKAILTRQKMNEIWSDIEAPLREHLLRLMDEFDLSYKVVDEEAKPKSNDRDQSLVVELLPLDEADYHRLWDSKSGEFELAIKFQLDRIPPAGIPTWFIARQHRFTTRIHWRLGALFADQPDNPKHLALVRASHTEKSVRLNVRGPFPINFFALLRDGLEATFKHFPGMNYSPKIPCKCRINCPHEFLLDTLNRAYESQREEWPCNDSLQNVSIIELLYGHRPASQDDPRFRKLHERFDKLEGALEENWAFEQREFLKLFSAMQSSEVTSCPNVFSIRFGSGDRDLIGLLEPIRSARMMDKFREMLWKERMELQLYCQAHGCWHPVGCERGKHNPETGLYQFEANSEILQKVGPLFIKVAKAMKYVLPVVSGISMPWVDDTEKYAEQFKKDVERMKKFADSAAKSLPELFKEPPTPKSGRKLADSYGVTYARGEELRALRAMLDSVRDPAKRWGRLSCCLTKEGHWLWLCPTHREQYEESGRI